MTTSAQPGCTSCTRRRWVHWDVGGPFPATAVDALCGPDKPFLLVRSQSQLLMLELTLYLARGKDEGKMFKGLHRKNETILCV
jgi:hypothetical protein